MSLQWKPSAGLNFPWPCFWWRFGGVSGFQTPSHGVTAEPASTWSFIVVKFSLSSRDMWQEDSNPVVAETDS